MNRIIKVTRTDDSMQWIGTNYIISMEERGTEQTIINLTDKFILVKESINEVLERIEQGI